MHFMTYVKHAYEVVLEGECRAGVTLSQEVESYLVHVIARYFDKPNVNKDPIAIKMLSAMNLPKSQKRQKLQEVAEECLLIDGFGYGRNNWPSKEYYVSMGQIAYGNIAYIERPPEIFYENIATEFKTISKVIRKLKN